MELKAKYEDCRLTGVTTLNLTVLLASYLFFLCRNAFMIDEGRCLYADDIEEAFSSEKEAQVVGKQADALKNVSDQFMVWNIIGVGLLSLTLLFMVIF